MAFFALGLLSALDRGPVESRLLLAVVGELGLSEGAARSLILRLRSQIVSPAPNATA